MAKSVTKTLLQNYIPKFRFQNDTVMIPSCLVLTWLDLTWLDLSCLVFSCLVLSCLVLSCRVLSRLVLSCLVLSCLVLSCLVLSCLALPCLAMSYLVFSGLVWPCLFCYWADFRRQTWMAQKKYLQSTFGAVPAYQFQENRVNRTAAKNTKTQ